MVLDHLAEYVRTAAELAAAFTAADPAAAVPSCPGWTVADLALHLGTGERWAAAILLSSTHQKEPTVLRTPASWSDWYSGTSAALAAAIRAVDPDEPCWNFAPVEQRAGFWSRRRLHETTVHLADALQSNGGTGLEAISTDIAADGIDEVLTVFLPRMLKRGFPSVVEAPLTIRTTDTGHQWTLTPGEPPAVDRAQAPAPTVISADAATLYLALWKRLPATSVTVEGDEAVAGTFLTGKGTP